MDFSSDFSVCSWDLPLWTSLWYSHWGTSLERLEDRVWQGAFGGLPSVRFVQPVGHSSMRRVSEPRCAACWNPMAWSLKKRYASRTEQLPSISAPVLLDLLVAMVLVVVSMVQHGLGWFVYDSKVHQCDGTEEHFCRSLSTKIRSWKSLERECGPESGLVFSSQSSQMCCATGNTRK